MWNAVAEHLLERFEEPTLLFDRGGRVLALNTALERLLGWPRAELKDQAWSKFSPPGEDSERAIARLQGSVQGLGRRVELPALAASGERLTLLISLAHIGGGEDQISIATVIAARPYELQTPLHTNCDEYYEISVMPGARGELGYVWSPSEEGGREVEGLCYKTFYGRSEPCVGCPAFNQEPAARAGDVHSGVVRFGEQGESFGMVTAEFTDKRARISLRRISREDVSALVRARVDLLAEEGSLSSREHSVLGLLVAGKSAEDIGGTLGISPRTAKFHQTNILQKLNVDSRLELFRLVVE
nr:LuxR C-terminal-related transcriptional regulator [Haliangium ochraceum]